MDVAIAAVLMIEMGRLDSVTRTIERITVIVILVTFVWLALLGLSASLKRVVPHVW